jgi:alkanesulfonate monooxygenase SsuD/methylene tetrahydromethanopterin reductase-like flavin-dependent oxidoreductase (luciferase family)
LKHPERTPMKFAYFTHLPWPEERRPEQIISETTDQVQCAEELGFYSAWLAEHHFTRYSIGSSSLIMAAHLAARTKKIRVGTAVLVSPLHNPLRLAEDTATLDLISGGDWTWASAEGLPAMNTTATM